MVPLPAEGRARRPRVLLAEDDDEMRALLALTLARDGYEVVEAADGARMLDALEQAVYAPRADRFDLIISDVRMPRLSGMDILAALRCSYCTTPVIMITAFGDDFVHAEARELGARAVLDKPFDLDVLRAAVHDAVLPDL